MNIEEILSQISAGGIVSVLIIILSLVEIAPIRISPLEWLGKRVNKATLDQVEKIDKKLDEHIAQSYRSKILNFQSLLIREGIGGHSEEAWKEVISASKAYKNYVEANKIENGYCDIAMEFIEESYKECLKKRDFANIPQAKIGEKDPN